MKTTKVVFIIVRMIWLVLCIMLTIEVFQSSKTTRDNEPVLLTSSATYQVDVTRNRKDNASVVVGTICKGLFRRMKLYKDCGTSYLTCSAPVLFKFRLGKTELDFGDLSESLQAKMRIGYTNKAKVRFAQRLYYCVEYMLENPAKDVCVHDLIAQLEAQDLVDSVLA